MCPLYKENKSLESKSSACKVKIFYREKKPTKRKEKSKDMKKSQNQPQVLSTKPFNYITKILLRRS